MAEERKLQIVIEAVDKASRVFEQASSKAQRAGEKIGAALDRAALPSAALATGLAFGAKSVLNASQDLENALLGLSRVAEAVGESQDDAKTAALSLANDGLMSVKDASEGLKNLLATGFSLPEAIRLMNAFRDAAAFNRQGTLAFGEAIVGATQGIKNQNSIMVDNAGITKNLSVILKEAGLSVNDLANVTTDAGVRTALYNGILKEAAIFEGDAATMAETYGGKLSQMNTEIFNARAALGDRLKPVMIGVIDLTTRLIDKTSSIIAFFEKHKTITIILAGAILGALTPALWAAAGAAAGFAAALSPFIVAGGIIATMVFGLDKLSRSLTGFGLLEQFGAMVELVKSKIQGLIDSVNTLIGSLNRLKNSRFNVLAQLKSLPEFINMQFAHGGMIPGHPNQPVPAILHGGERIVSRTGVDVGGGSSNGVVINFNGDMSLRSDQDITILAQEISRILGKQSEYARIGVGA